MNDIYQLPALNRADPYSDAVTATILHQLATTKEEPCTPQPNRTTMG